MKRRMLGCLLMLWAVCLYAANALAAEADGTGSLTVVMHAGEETVPGGVLALYYMGPGTDKELTPELAKDLEEQAQDMTGERRRIARDGSTVFSGLELGVYLVTQPEAAVGYRKMSPFLITVPLQQDGELLYDIFAYPKLEKEPANPVNPDTGQPHLPLFLLILSGGGLLVLLSGKSGTHST